MNQVSESATSVGHPTPTAPIAREWDLLLAASAAGACGADDLRIRSLLERPAGERPVDWQTVLRLAHEHGTSSLLYQNLSRFAGAVPPAVLTNLRERYQKNVHKSLFLARELIRILDFLDALGIDVISYKGVVLSEIYYDDMALRQTGDIDLFVRKRDVTRIQDAARQLGYTRRAPVPQDAEEDYVASGYECSFDSPAGPGLLEIQWALQPRFYSVDFDMGGLFERAENVRVAGRHMKTPCGEDLLLVLCVHAAKHVWERLIWLCDIAQILKRENFDWESVKSRAGELGIKRIVSVTLLLANRLLAAPIPSPIEKSVIADRAVGALAEEIATGLAAGFSCDVQQVSYFRLMMRLRERRADRLRFLARLTFTPGPGEWEAVRLPKVLFPLYRVVRLARLASRFARG